MGMNKTTTPPARLAAIIAKATGATIDPILACPNVEADGALAFCADPTEAALIVAAMRDVHGVDGIAASVDSSDPDDVYAVVRVPLASLERRLAALVAA